MPFILYAFHSLCLSLNEVSDHEYRTVAYSTIQIKCYLLKEIISPSSGMSNLSLPIFIFFASFRKTALVVRQ